MLIYLVIGFGTLATRIRSRGQLLPSPLQIAMTPCKSPQIASISALFRPEIAIVDVVSVLPYVAAKQRPAAVNQRVLAVGCLGNFELPILQREPAPA